MKGINIKYKVTPTKFEEEYVSGDFKKTDINGILRNGFRIENPLPTYIPAHRIWEITECH